MVRPPLARPDFGCGCSSGVEHDLAKVGVEGSNPFARSKNTPIFESLTIRVDGPAGTLTSLREAWGKQRIPKHASWSLCQRNNFGRSLADALQRTGSLSHYDTSSPLRNRTHPVRLNW
jgi:hypothetical protein